MVANFAPSFANYVTFRTEYCFYAAQRLFKYGSGQCDRSAGVRSFGAGGVTAGASVVVCDASFGSFGQAKIAIILLTVSVISAISDTKR